MNYRIALLYGGSSAERDVSLASGQAVLNALTQLGHDVVPFDTANKPLSDLAAMNIDLAFIMLHGRGGEDGTIQGALEFMQIPYTGSGVLGSALAMDKIVSKQVWIASQLPTPAYRFCHAPINIATASEILLALGGEVMVKPSREGSSIGMAKVDQGQALVDAVNAALAYDDDVLLEQFIAGQEYTVAVLGQEALPSIRMETPHSFYDYAAKYVDNTTLYHCPSGLADEEEQALRTLAKKAFAALHCKGWGRIDAMRDANGQFLLLEANTVPGMTEKSLVPKAAYEHGLSFNALVNSVIHIALGQDVSTRSTT